MLKKTTFPLSTQQLRDFLPWFHAPHHVFDVLSDLIGGLQAKEVEVSQQVVMEGQELEVQLGQSQAAWEDQPVNVRKAHQHASNPKLA